MRILVQHISFLSCMQGPRSDFDSEGANRLSVSLSVLFSALPNSEGLKPLQPPSNVVPGMPLPAALLLF